MSTANQNELNIRDLGNPDDCWVGDDRYQVWEDDEYSPQLIAMGNDLDALQTEFGPGLRIYSKVEGDFVEVPTTKSIGLYFVVPGDTDLPSEKLAAMKQLLLDALAEKETKHEQGILRMRPERLALCKALLTES